MTEFYLCFGQACRKFSFFVNPFCDLDVLNASRFLDRHKSYVDTVKNMLQFYYYYYYYFSGVIN